MVMPQAMSSENATRNDWRTLKEQMTEHAHGCIDFMHASVNLLESARVSSAALHALLCMLWPPQTTTHIDASPVKGVSNLKCDQRCTATPLSLIHI